MPIYGHNRPPLVEDGEEEAHPQLLEAWDILGVFHIAEVELPREDLRGKPTKERGGGWIGGPVWQS